MLSLRSFHLFFVALSVVLCAAVGVWSLTHAHSWMGIVLLLVGALLVVYFGYVATRMRRVRVD